MPPAPVVATGRTGGLGGLDVGGLAARAAVVVEQR